MGKQLLNQKYQIVSCVLTLIAFIFAALLSILSQILLAQSIPAYKALLSLDFIFTVYLGIEALLHIIVYSKFYYKIKKMKTILSLLLATVLIDIILLISVNNIDPSKD